jgi:PAS domain S-box-containing protein
MDLVQACGHDPVLLEDVLSALQQVVILTDSNGIIQYACRIAEITLEYPPDKLVDQNVSVIFTEEDLTYMLPNLLQLCQQETPFEGEVMLRRRSGARFFAYMVVRSLGQDENGGRRVIFCIQDIDKHKNLEKAIRDTHFEDLVKIANGIAHEIRNPLVGIGGFTNRLYQSCHATIAHEQYYDYIMNNLKRIENLVRKVNYLVSLPDPNFRSDRLDIIVDEAMRLYKNEFEQHRIIWENKVEEIRLLVDRDLVVRAVAILLENALDAASEGGRIFASNVVDDNFCDLMLSDTGAGISPKDLPYVFHPFFSTKAGGAGIDLAVVRRIMECHKGLAEVESVPGHGATFKLRFPLERRRRIRIESLVETP